MIEINLLPQELKIKDQGVNVLSQWFIYLIPLLLGTLLCLHLYFGIFAVILGGKQMVMNNQWNQMQPQKIALDNFKKQNAVLTGDSKALLDLLSLRINWSEKLNSLSIDLPYGIWFRDLNANPKELVIQGLAISLQKEELTLINKFISNLKDDADFFNDFAGIELKSVQTKSVGIYDVVEFGLSAVTKKK